MKKSGRKGWWKSPNRQVREKRLKDKKYARGRSDDN